MKTKHSQPPTRRLLQSMTKAFCLFAGILMAGSFSAISAQQAIVYPETVAVCNGSNPVGSQTIASIFLDNQTLYAGTEYLFPPGSHNLRVIARPPSGQEGSWVIKSIAFNWPGGRIENHTPNTAEANLPLNIPSLPDASTIKIIITIDRCGAPSSSGPVHVQIATTQSCTDDPNGGFAVQEGVTVSIGGKTFTSNAKGVIEADLPPGTYPVSASWKDYALGYVAQNGLRQKRNEDGLFTVRLSDKVETLEVRMLTCDPSGQPKARAVVLEGFMKVIRDSGPGGTPKADVGMQLRDGDLVIIQGTGKLKWLDGNGIINFETPRASTNIRIGPDQPAGRAAPPSQSGRGAVEVLKGLVEFIMPPQENDARDENGNILKFHATTRDVAITIRNTIFSLGYDEQTQISTIIAKEGTVWVTPTNTSLKPFALQAGQQAQVGPNSVSPITPIDSTSSGGSGGGAGGVTGGGAGSQTGAQSSDLSGLWVDDTGGGAIYRVRQVGNKFYWSVDATSKGSFVNVYYGEISGNMINGEWVDLPGSPSLGGGRLTLRIESNDRLVKAAASGPYGARAWMRMGSSSSKGSGGGNIAGGNTSVGGTTGGSSSGDNTGSGSGAGGGNSTGGGVTSNNTGGGTGNTTGNNSGGGAGTISTATPIKWDSTAVDYRDQFGKYFTFICPPNGNLTAIWGTDTYTQDSSICTAAVHAGKITRRSGGKVTIRIARPIPEYAATLRNQGTDDEVQSRHWDNPVGSYQSFTFAAGEVVGLAQQVKPTGTRAGVAKTPATPTVEEIPETAVKNVPRTGNRNPPQVEEIPEGAVKQTGNPGNVNRSGNSPKSTPGVEEIPEEAVSPNRPRAGDVPASTTPPAPQTTQPATPRAGILQLVEIKPDPPCSTWGDITSCDPNGGQITWGAASYQWSSPPQQVGPEGFTITMSASEQPPPGGRYSTGLNMNGGDFELDPPNATIPIGGPNQPLNGNLTVKVKPPKNLSGDHYIKIGVYYGPGFTYHYRVVQ
jgi:hypothetical protein